MNRISTTAGRILHCTNKNPLFEAANFCSQRNLVITEEKVSCHLIYCAGKVLSYLNGCRVKMACQVVKGNPYKSICKGKGKILKALKDSDECSRMGRKIR